MCTGRGSTTPCRTVPPLRAVPLCTLRVRRTAEAAPTRNQEPTALRAGLSEAPIALRAGRREAKAEAPRPACHFKAESLRPTTAARTGPPDPGGRSQARRRPACGHARRTSPPAPDDSAGCRHGFRLASTASRSCTQRADAAPAFAVDRSLSGRSRLGCSRRADLGLLRSKTAHGAAGLCVAAPAARSRPVVNGRTERRKIEAASSRRRWTLGPPRWIAAGVPVLPLSGALGSNSAAVSARHELRWRLQSCRMSFRFT